MTIAGNPIGCHAGHDTGRAEEGLRGRQVTRLAQPHIHQMTVAVDGPIQVTPSAIDLNVVLVIDTRRTRPIPCTAEAHIRAARELGYVAGPCPAAILPPDFSQVNQWGTPIEGCAGCAHCPLGCRRPTAQPLHRKAKRTMQVAAITIAESLGTEVISDAHVTRITRDASGAADGVEYKRAGDSTTHTAKAHVVFLAGGAIESPRLYINSELPDPNPSQPQVGHWLTDHQEVFVVFFHDELMKLEEILSRQVGQSHLVLVT